MSPPDLAYSRQVQLQCAAPRSNSVGQVAQLVEQRTENPRVGGSIPPLATILFKDLRLFREILKKPLREFCVT